MPELILSENRAASLVVVRDYRSSPEVVWWYLFTGNRKIYLKSGIRLRGNLKICHTRSLFDKVWKLLSMGRDIIYDSWSCDLICTASSPDLYRINLEQGRFLSSLNTQSPALNVVSRSRYHGLIAGGGGDGAAKCFDMRTNYSAARLDAVTFFDEAELVASTLMHRS